MTYERDLTALLSVADYEVSCEDFYTRAPFYGLYSETPDGVWLVDYDERTDTCYTWFATNDTTSVFLSKEIVDASLEG
jgi:hypothetical protein